MERDDATTTGAPEGPSDLDEDLQRISRSTEDLAPRDGFTSRVMGAVGDADAADDPMADVWAELGERTAALEPSRGFTDRVMSAVLAAAVAPIDPLESVAERTALVDTSPGFDDRVMARVRRTSRVQRIDRRSGRGGLGEGLAKNGLKALLAAAAVAAAAMFYASSSERDFEADVIASVDVVEAGD